MAQIMAITHGSRKAHPADRDWVWNAPALPLQAAP
jgi:hypothetical protein